MNDKYRLRPGLVFHPRHWPMWFGLGVLRLLGALPLPAVAAIGGGLGMLLYMLLVPRRRIARINLQLCFPDLPPRRIDALVRRHFRAFGQTLVDVTIAWWGSAQRMRRVVRFRDRHYYDEVKRTGRNVILLAPHFIGLEMGGIRLSLDSSLVSVFRQPANMLMQTLMWRARTRFGLKLFDHNQSFKSLVRVVQSGVPLYYLPDQDGGDRHALFAPFFGVSAATHTTLSRLARMTNAVVIPCITYQLKWGKGYEICFRPPLDNFPSDDALQDTTRMNAEIERAIQTHPEQYFWLHKRFKTRPPGEPSVY